MIVLIFGERIRYEFFVDYYGETVFFMLSGLLCHQAVELGKKEE